MPPVPAQKYDSFCQCCFVLKVLRLLKLPLNLQGGVCSWEGEGEGMEMWTEKARAKQFGGTWVFTARNPAVLLEGCSVQLTDLCKCVGNEEKASWHSFRRLKKDSLWFAMILIYLFYHSETLQKQELQMSWDEACKSSVGTLSHSWTITLPYTFILE